MNESRVPLELAQRVLDNLDRNPTTNFAVAVRDAIDAHLPELAALAPVERDRPIPPVSDEDVNMFLTEYRKGGDWTAALNAYRSRLLAHRWQPVTPGTRIEPGTNARVEWDASPDAPLCVAGAGEYLPLTVATYADGPGGRRWYINPATVPAPDPDAELVDQLAKRMHDDSGCEDPWPCSSASTREDYQMWARDLIDAVREHDGGVQ